MKSLRMHHGWCLMEQSPILFFDVLLPRSDFCLLVLREVLVGFMVAVLCGRWSLMQFVRREYSSAELKAHCDQRSPVQESTFTLVISTLEMTQGATEDLWCSPWRNQPTQAISSRVLYRYVTNASLDSFRRSGRCVCR